MSAPPESPFPSNYSSPRTGRGTSRRWVTTTSEALESVAAQLGSVNRGKLVSDLKERKINNTKTSILFGRDKVDYTSDTQENLKSILQGIDTTERLSQFERNKQMKTALTRTNFNLGDEKVVYETSSRLPPIDKNAGHTEMIRPKMGSSINFGTEPTVYSSSAHDAMVIKGNGTIDYTSMKDEVVKLKTHLRKHNFTFGEEPVDYTSDYKRGFKNIAHTDQTSGPSKEKLKKTIEDTRKCHFTLGNDQPEYVSNTSLALRNSGGVSAEEVRKNLENSKKLKQQLQRTSFVVGFDEEYM